jgi:hypothetical protein
VPPEERPLIASVFHNRLKKGMRLETDPTVIYGISDFDGNIKRRHLETHTPYNTYKIKGLASWPHCQPGGPCHGQAALYPAQSEFLYFVSKKDGTHQFSTTIKATQCGGTKVPVEEEENVEKTARQAQVRFHHRCGGSRGCQSSPSAAVYRPGTDRMWNITFLTGETTTIQRFMGAG